MSLRKSLLGAAAALALVVSAGAANASIIATLNTISASTGTPGGFDFNYSATLAADEQISTGSYLVLYDWGTVLGAKLPTSATGIMASNFAFTQQLSGPTPAFTAPTDSGSVLNVVATYNGNTVSGFALGNGATGNLGTFTLTSPLGGRNAGGFQGSSAQHFNPSGTNTGTQDSNVTTTTVPAAVPEPASLAILGGALALAGMVRRRRRA